MTIALLARSASADETLTAEALFRAARDAMTREDFATACAKFAESQKLDPAPGTLLNIGECSERLGRKASAWKAYAEAADRLSGDSRRDFAIQKRDELSKGLATLSVAVTGEAADCTLKEDGIPLGRVVWAEPIPVDPGEHAVELACPGKAPAGARLRVTGAGPHSISIAPGAKSKAPEGPKTAEASSAMPIAGWVLSGVGIASIGVGAATGALVLDRKAKVNDLCTHAKTPQCPKAGVDAAHQGKTFSTISTITFVGGIALMGVGVTLVLVGHAKKPAEPHVALDLGIAPSVGVHGAF